MDIIRTFSAFTSSAAALFLISSLVGCVVQPVANSPSPSARPSATPFPTGLIQKAYSPTWSSDGQRIAFLFRTRKEGTQEVKDALYSSLLDGSDVFKIRDLSPSRFGKALLDPTGERFLLTTENTSEIYYAEKNGDNFQKLVDGDTPSWDSTGTKFVCTYDNACETVDRVGGRQCQRQIRLYDIASQTYIALPVTLEREVFAPAWSSDGYRIQWLSTHIEPTKELSTQILELHNYDLATRSHQVTEVNPIELTFANGTWSQDRTMLAFNYLSRIHLLFFNTAKTFSIVEGTDPSLSNDGSRILYSNLLNENKGDIAIFDRRDNSVNTIVSHRSLPFN
jgi:hypothetical protein